jgi:uncharacterized protein
MDAGTGMGIDDELPETALIAAALANVRRHRMEPWGMHGLAHWWRVRHNGLLVADAMGASRRVVTLFAIFHDSHRMDDGIDPLHGPRAAEWLAEVREHRADANPRDVAERAAAAAPHGACEVTRRTIHALDDHEFESLRLACELHTRKLHHDNPSVAACFVADRLDLSRVGFRPDPARMPAPRALLTDAFIEAAVARERAGLAWPGGEGLVGVWGVRRA